MNNQRLYLASQFVTAVAILAWGVEAVRDSVGAPSVAGVLMLVGGAGMTVSVAWQALGGGSAPAVGQRETYLMAGAALLVVVGIAARLLAGAG